MKTEPFLEKWARYFRFREVTPALQSYLERSKRRITIVDFGCGQDILYKKYLDLQFHDTARRVRYIGIDPLIHPHAHDRIGHAEIIRSKFEHVSLSHQADIVIMLAVLEHVDDASALLESAARLLKPGGLILGTTPGPLAKLPLEFFSSILGIISVREIEEHKRYPTRESLRVDVKRASKRVGKKLSLRHHYFELGLNNYFEIRLSR